MNNYKIRMAKVDDIEAILTIIDDARELITSFGFKQWTKESNYPNKFDFINDINNKSLFVVVDDEIVIAVFAFIVGDDENYNNIEGAWLNNQQYSTIHRLAVKKKYYGKHISHLIFNFCYNYNITNKIASLRIDTHKNNIIMNKSAKKYGFKFCGIIYIKDAVEEPERNAYEILTKR